jgi:predicted 2-oxoglutarate/Fe(II)-dependent dioxygenase YbiX/peroxiredoxin
MRLSPGDPAHWFVASSTRNPAFHFSTLGGRYIVLCFFGSAGNPASRTVLDEVERNRHRFSEQDFLFCGVSVDPDDQRLDRVPADGSGVLHFWDFDEVISRGYSAREAVSDEYQPFTVVIDAGLRVLAVFEFGDHPETHVSQWLKFLDILPPLAETRGHAPILVLPRVFEPEFCRELIQEYDTHGGKDSGFMREVDGKTVGAYDYSFKRRRDYHIEDKGLRKRAMVKIHDRLMPEIRKYSQFRATRMERYVVCCYDSATSDHFQPHRDDTSKGTAHRRFAVTIHLNSDEYEGGEVRFPEYGPETYRAPTGAAIVFCCKMLHGVTPVTRGRRLVFLPFLYDDAAAKIREANNPHLGNAVDQYRTDSDAGGR